MKSIILFPIIMILLALSSFALTGEEFVSFYDFNDNLTNALPSGDITSPSDVYRSGLAGLNQLDCKDDTHDASTLNNYFNSTTGFVCMWLNPDDATTEQFVLGANQGTVSDRFYFNIRNNEIRYVFGSGDQTGTGTDVQVGSFNHYCLSWNNSKTYVWVNATITDERTTPGSFDGTTWDNGLSLCDFSGAGDYDGGVQGLATGGILSNSLINDLFSNGEGQFSMNFTAEVGPPPITSTLQILSEDSLYELEAIFIHLNYTYTNNASSIDDGDCDITLNNTLYDTTYNTTSGLYDFTSGLSLSDSGLYEIYSNCTHSNVNLDNTAVKNLTILNIVPTVNISRLVYGFGTVNLFDNIVIEYSANSWNWLIDTNDNDLVLGEAIFTNIVDEVIASFNLTQILLQEVLTGNRTSSPPNVIPYSSYQFDEGSGIFINDSSGYGRTGTKNGGLWKPSKGGNGTGNYSIFFDGINDYIDLGETHNFDTDDSFSISMWAKRNVTSVTQNMIARRYVGVPVRAGWNFLFASDDTLSFYMASNVNDLNKIVVYTNEVVDNTEWNHVVVTYNGNEYASGLQFYLNGELLSKNVVQNNIIGHSMTTTGVNTLIGTKEFSQHFNGNLDNIVITDYVMSQSDIISLYNEGVTVETIAFAEFLEYSGNPYNLFVNVTDDNGLSASQSLNFYVNDTRPPELDIYSVDHLLDNSSSLNEGETLNIDVLFRDEALFTTGFKLYLDNETVLYEYSDLFNPPITEYRLIDNVDVPYDITRIYGVANATDAHTLTDVYDRLKQTVNKGLENEIKSSKFNLRFNDAVDKIDLDYRNDRVKQKIQFNKKLSQASITIFPLDNADVHIIESDKYFTYLVIDDYWLDFVSKDTESVLIQKINDEQYEVTVYFDKEVKNVDFESIGIINTKSVDFYITISEVIVPVVKVVTTQGVLFLFFLLIIYIAFMLFPVFAKLHFLWFFAGIVGIITGISAFFFLPSAFKADTLIATVWASSGLFNMAIGLMKGVPKLR